MTSFETFSPNDEPTKMFDFQDLTPSSHKEFLKCILESFQKDFASNLKSNI